MKKLRATDIVLTHDNGLTSGLWRFLMRSHWNHAGIITGSIIENGKLVDYKILEACGGGAKENRLFEKYGYENIAIYRMRGKVPFYKRQKVLNGALALKGLPYDYGIALRLVHRVGWRKAFHILKDMVFGKETFIPHEKDIWVVCSELVQEAYEDAKMPLIDNQILLLPGRIAKLRNTKLEQIYGKDID